MSAPRLEIDLGRLHHNASTLVTRLGARGISVTGVTKATLGSPEVARELLAAGITSLGDSRVENLEALRRAGLSCHMTLIRSPMPSQAARVVECANTSLNTELDVIDRLSTAARHQGRPHDVVLMVELGDLREGILPGDLEAVARRTLLFPQIRLRGIGANLACQHGVAPDERNMAELSTLADMLEHRLGLHLDVVSGGNSANLDWALGTDDVGRVDDLRLGESILLGLEPLHRHPIDGLHTDAITLVAEVIESKRKPRRPWGALGESAFGAREPIPSTHVRPSEDGWRAIVALGHQDTDPGGLRAPEGLTILGASSDHLVVDLGNLTLPVGAEIRFGVNYSALVRAMTSPFVRRDFLPAVMTGTGDSDLRRRGTRAGAPLGSAGRGSPDARSRSGSPPARAGTGPAAPRRPIR